MDQSSMRKKVKAKALAMAQGIDKMPESAKGRNASGDLGDDYNRLRSLAIEADPGCERFLPPAVENFRNDVNYYYCYTAYQEIMTYCLQIAEIIDD